jgi:hypothetical protein
MNISNAHEVQGWRSSLESQRRPGSSDRSLLSKLVHSSRSSAISTMSLNPLPFLTHWRIRPFRLLHDRDHHNCLEVLAVRGKAATIKKIADQLIAAKGVKHGKLTVTSIGKDLPS